MSSQAIGTLIRESRRRLNLSQAELAQKTGVSTRLLAELERGQRPNVSLETTLKLLGAVDVSVQLTAPTGSVVSVQGPSSGARERAAYRREHWTGSHVPLRKSGHAPSSGQTPEDAIMAVMQVSHQAFALKNAGRRKRSSPR